MTGAANGIETKTGDYERLIGDVTQWLVKRLERDVWETVEPFGAQLPKEFIARARAAPGAGGAIARGVLVDRVLSDVVKHLVAAGGCEVQGAGVALKVRLGQDSWGEACPGGRAEVVPAPVAPPESPPEGAATTETIVVRSLASLRPHPKAEMIPRMPPEQRQSFEDDVKMRGVQEAIFITEGGVIIDGLSRHEAQGASGRTTIPCVVKDWGEEEQERHMIRLAAQRRHLTDDQRAALAARLYQLEVPQARQERARKGGQAGGRGRAKKVDSSQDTPSTEQPAKGGRRRPGETKRQEVARRSGVSERQLKDALEVQKHDPATLDEVASGEVKLPAAKKKARQKAGLPAPTPKPPPQIDKAATAALGADGLATATPAGEPVHVLSLPAASGRALLDALIGAVGLGPAGRAAGQARRGGSVPGTQA